MAIQQRMTRRNAIMPTTVMIEFLRVLLVCFCTLQPSMGFGFFVDNL
jgi:hypothetical protein